MTNIQSVASLPNLGIKSAEKLAQIGYSTREQVLMTDALEIYISLRQAFGKEVNLTMLWAIRGAQLDIDWRLLPPEIKADLRQQLKQKE